MPSRLAHLFAVTGALIICCPAPGALAQAPPAQPREAPQRFNIAAGALDVALKQWAKQSRQNVLFDSRLVDGRTAPALSGELTADEALAQLLTGSGLVADHPRPGVVTLRQAGPAPVAPPLDAPASDTAEAAQVVVTGTLIRGRSDGPSPLITLDRAELDRSGRATVADALSALPQAFTGMATPQTQILQTDGVANNTAASTGVNLRGVGVSSTLVLVNGRRLPGSGLAGDFADVSVVPTAAVDRVEVLLDGASALYGSDAVGGVVNIRLRTDYSGAETRLRVGGATEGGDFDTIVGQTFGQAWRGGHVLASYEHESSDALRGAERAYTASADLRPLGGTDHRLIYSYPGNILGSDPDTGALSPLAAIPAGQDGRSLSPADLQLGAQNLENWRALGDILPAQARDSFYLDASQDLGRGVTATASVLHTRRSFTFDLPEMLSVFDVTADNPFFVTPNGASDELIGYAFGRELGGVRTTGASSASAASFGLDFSLPHDWRLEGVLSFAQDDEHTTSRNLVNTAFLNEALGASPDDPATPYSPARDGYFNPFGGDGVANSPEVLSFIGSGTSTTRNLSDLGTLDLKLDGTLLTLPGGPLQIAIGAQLRRERFKPTGESLTDGVDPLIVTQEHYARSVSAGFAELRVPIVGPGNRRPGLYEVALSLAGRVEDYSDVGVTGNPKLGIVWRPWADLKLRGSWGTSFRAPALTEEFSQQQIIPSFLPRGSDQVLTLIEVGGDPGLRPETATTWSAGADYNPARLKGLTLSLNGFGIDYQDRIGQPAYEDLSNALTNPDYASFVTPVAPATSTSDLALVQALIARSTSSAVALFPPDSYGAVVDARYVNASKLTVRGVDAAFSYRTRIGEEHVGFAADAAYLAEYRRQLTTTSTPVELLGQTGQPSDLRLRSALDWSHGAFDASLAWTHVDGSRSEAGAHVDSWDTADLELGWRARTPSGPLRGVAATLTVLNLLDTDPPFYDSPLGVGYDTANADARGRVVALQLVKTW